MAAASLLAALFAGLFVVLFWAGLLVALLIGLSTTGVAPMVVVWVSMDKVDGARDPGRALFRGGIVSELSTRDFDLEKRGD